MTRSHSSSSAFSPSAVPIIAADASQAAESAHRELWRRFIYGIMIDFADGQRFLCRRRRNCARQGQARALGWWAPIEMGDVQRKAVYGRGDPALEAHEV
jgi:hypothetical protein